MIIPLSTIFKGNTLIRTFSELVRFTNMKTIGSGVFNGCTNLTSVNCSNITHCGSGAATATNYPFANTNISKLELPNVVTLRQYAFTTQTNGSTHFKRIILGKGLTSVHRESFRSTWNTVFVLYAENPPTASGALSRYNMGNSCFYVPDDSVAAYKASSVWANWVNYIKPLSEYVE